MNIKILGVGCAKCHQVEKLANAAVAEAGVAAVVELVTDFKVTASYGVFGTPAVVVDSEVKSVGRIPKKEEILAWLGQKVQ